MTSDAYDTEHTSLLTDLYQLTMLQAYYDQRMFDTAVFEFFIRSLPAERNFLVAAGLQQALQFLQEMQFSVEEIDWLIASGLFREDFLRWLSGFRFTGTVDAMAEGTVFFPDEPIIRVIAPLPQAQLVESRLINILHFQTLIASKAARVRLMSSGKLLVDFGLRRAHEASAGLFSARASYIAGFDGTSTVLAGKRWSIPLYGTMAHSFIQAGDNESEAFEAFSKSHPNATTLLIDTYNTEEAASRLGTLAQRLARQGIFIQAVRLDSGDLTRHSENVRRILDESGLSNVKIFASGNLDEYELHRLQKSKAPIDGFGVGTHMNTSADRAYLDCAYKLQEYAGRARRKRSEGKSTWPGRKQVYRHYDSDGCMEYDQLSLITEPNSGQPLLTRVMVGGRSLQPQPSLTQSRDHARDELSKLPRRLRGLDSATPYPVRVTNSMIRLAAEVDNRLRPTTSGER